MASAFDKGIFIDRLVTTDNEHREGLGFMSCCSFWPRWVSRMNPTTYLPKETYFSLFLSRPNNNNAHLTKYHQKDCAVRDSNPGPFTVPLTCVSTQLGPLPKYRVLSSAVCDTVGCQPLWKRTR